MGSMGILGDKAVTLAEVLRQSGYATCMSGKWHVTRRVEAQNWPYQRGFDKFFGIVLSTGAVNYWQPRTRNNVHVEPQGEDFVFMKAISDPHGSNGPSACRLRLKPRDPRVGP